MLFSSATFLLFFLPLVLVAYYFPIKANWYRNVVLLLFSLFFYAWGEPCFVFVLAISILINWIFTLFISKLVKKSRKVLTGVLLSLDISLLFVYKYLDFFGGEFASYILKDRVEIDIVLPLGISFFTFQIMSYVIDVYNDKIDAQKSLYKFALYVVMFPQLVAGPIVRYAGIEDEIDHRKENLELFGSGVIRFVYGLSKKVLLADYMGVIADNMFYLSENGELSVMSALLGAVTYMLQIYFDFSGYSDMAIGLGMMFGFHFCENFNYPYIAKSVTEFWHRWHISLSSWFRDYVYIPLGGNRCSVGRHVLNLLIVWLLTGLWHGASWNFILWGIGYFIVLMIEKYILKYRTIKGLSYICTIVIVGLLWILFRAETLPLAWKYVQQLFGSSGVVFDEVFATYFNEGWIAILVAVVCCLPIIRFLSKRTNQKVVEVFKAVLGIPLYILCLANCVSGSYSPFIYFNF